MYPLVPNGGTMIYPAWACDVLSDDLGVLENALSDSTQVVNFYDTDSFKEYCKWVYQWAQEGLMMPDAVNTTEGYQEFFNSGVGLVLSLPSRQDLKQKRPENAVKTS